MALNPKITTAVANAMADALGDQGDSGLLRIYEGSQPTDADTAVGAQTLLAELTMNAAAFPPASGGVLTAATITDDSSANATGTASWFRLLKSDGTTVLMDGTVGTSGADLNLDDVSITSGATVSVTSFTITMPKG